MRAKKSGLSHISSDSRASSRFFFLNLMIKLLMFNKLGNFNKFTKLSKDFGELNDKLIIQHFHHIHIRTHARRILQILSHSKLHNIYLFH